MRIKVYALIMCVTFIYQKSSLDTFLFVPEMTEATSLPVSSLVGES